MNLDESITFLEIINELEAEFVKIVPGRENKGTSVCWWFLDTNREWEGVDGCFRINGR